MDEEKSMKGEAPSNFVKNRIVITQPSGMTVEQFEKQVIAWEIIPILHTV